VERQRREALFQQVVDDHGRALARLCAGYERGEAQRRELEQEILLNLWRALPTFLGEASLRTWMYRVAHNVASRHVRRAVRAPNAQGEDEAADQPSAALGVDHEVDRSRARRRLRALIEQLKPLDRQIIMLYLEDVPQTEIAHITGLSQANVSTRAHRIKAELSRRMSA